jgi:hypothetical protein
LTPGRAIPDREPSPQASPGRGSPTVRRRRLGAELRRLREAAGLTIEQAGDALECSASKISRIETGQIGASPRDVRDLLVLFRVPEPEAETLVQLARDARLKGWWQPYGSVLTGAYVGFEAAAESIRSYECQCVPGLLQTEDYARSLILAGRGNTPPSELEDRIRVRMARQTLVTQEDPLRFWAVLDESVLARPVGGPAVMRAQLGQILTRAALPHVTVQVLPFRVGGHPAMEGSFSIIHFPDPADPDMVFIAMATGGAFQEKPEDVARYNWIFDGLRDAALSPDESMKLIEEWQGSHHDQ